MKNKLRKIVQTFGLIPITDGLIKVFSLKSSTSYLLDFKYYIYNHWITNFPSFQVRKLYICKVLGIPIGIDSFIHMGCFFEGENTVIGDNCGVGRNCYLGGRGGKLTIKNNVSVTAQTYIFCSTHLKNSPTFECVYEDITIEDNVWIGARAMILPGVRIGEGAILGATSTATKDIPEYSIYAGSPAKEIGKRSKNLRYKLKYFPRFQ